MGTACLAKNFQLGTPSKSNAQRGSCSFKLSENSKPLLEGYLYIGV